MGANALELLHDSSLARCARACCFKLTDDKRCAECRAADEAVKEYRTRILKLASAVVRIHLVKL